MAKTFREVWKWLLPRNFAKPEQVDDEGALVAQSLTTVIDTTLTRAREGLNARFPTRAGQSGNELTAADRGIIRGRSESDDAFEARLVAWRTPRTHRVRGNAYELLVQIQAYWGGIECAAIANGYEHRLDTAGVYTKTARAFDWDGVSRWWRFWIELYPNPTITVDDSPDLGDAALWGGALGTPGYTLGQTGVTPADVLAMRNLFQQYAWHSEHATPEWVVVSINGDPLDPGGASNRWSYYDAGTETQRPSRDSSFRFWSLNPPYNNTYSGDPENFPVYAVQVDQTGTYGPGDPENAAAWGAITLPTGATYAGDPETFPESVLLLDDGSLPK